MKQRDRTWIGASIVAAFISATGTLFWRDIPTSNEQLLTYMLGQISGLATAIVTFHYGSSRGSEDKTAAMAAMTDEAKAAPDQYDWKTFGEKK